LIPGTLAFILYFITCSPTVNFTDSGELITVAWTGGIAHPPGYPLYTLLGSAFVHLPFGDPAWRLNILSALFAALAISLFYLLVTDTLLGMPAFLRTLASRSGRPRTSPGNSARTLSRAPVPKATAAERRANRAAASLPKEDLTGQSRTTSPAIDEGPAVWAAVAGGMSASGLLAVSVTFWNWATQAKFYTLHFAFVAALLWLALRARRALITEVGTSSQPTSRWPPKKWPPSIRLLHLLAFTIGLSLTNHFLTFLLLPGIAVLLLTPFRYVRPTLRRIVRYSGTLVLAGLLPLLIYLYLPIRAATHPLIAWGLPDTWNNFWRQVTAQSYQGYFGGANLGNHIADAIIYAINQFGPWVTPLLFVPIVTGIIHLWRTDRGLMLATALIALTDLLVVLNYNIREIVTYYVPFYMVALWWAGIGVAQGVLSLSQRLSAGAVTNTATTASSTRSTQMVLRNLVIPLVLGALLPLMGLGVNWGAAGHKDNYTAELFARNAFKNYKQNAFVMTNYWDLTSATFYLQHVLNERQDVVLIDKSVLRNPFYLDYLERNYPDVVSKNAGPVAEYKALLLQWIDTGKTPAQLPAAYINMLKGFIDTNLGQRPVYIDFIIESNDRLEQQEDQALIENRQDLLVPNGFGYRISAGADDLQAQDPQFDLRGVTNQKVPLDEIEASVIALYPSALQRIGTYLDKSSTPAAKDAAAKLLAQAQELQPFTAFHDARPRLR
jgi:hypothetical protein